MEPPKELSQPKDKLILIADDDEPVREFLNTIVSNEGFRVVTAKDGPDALAKIEQNKPDLIITDLMMPGQGGYEVLRQLQTPETRRIPIIVVTASRVNDSTIQMIRSEANVIEFISKPIQIPVLVTALHHYLRTKPPELQKDKLFRLFRPNE
ncbi:MAG: response regulator [Elusimicrobia bacterium]|nr:response regulator [Elusimicrobiota bacterium]